MRKSIFFSFLIFLVSFRTNAQENIVLITNANVFDGKNKALQNGLSVLIEGNKISKIAKTISVPKNATVIDAKGKTLIPGLTDMHWHVMFNTPSIPQL